MGVGVNSTLFSDTLQSIGLAESDVARAKVWFRKKTIDCVNSTLLSDTLQSIGLTESAAALVKVWNPWINYIVCLL